MRASYFAVCLPAVVLASLPVHAEEKTPGFSIRLGGSLETIDVKDGKLHYLYYRERKDSFHPQQNLDSFDRFDIQVWLSKEELAAFRDWMDRNKVFDLPEKYETKEQSYGSASEGGLTVEQGDKKHAIVWNGDSKTPESLGIAVSELRKLADDMAKSRTK